MSNSRRQLVLTAVFALAGAFFGIAGTGHAYLQRWKRSILWFVLTLGSGVALMSVYVTDIDAVDPFDLTTIPSEVYIPIVIIIGFSVIDALLVAYLDQQERELTPGVEADSEEGADQGVSCPHCGRSTDPELEFCTWCTESLADSQT